MNWLSLSSLTLLTLSGAHVAQDSKPTAKSSPGPTLAQMLKYKRCMRSTIAMSLLSIYCPLAVTLKRVQLKARTLVGLHYIVRKMVTLWSFCR